MSYKAPVKDQRFILEDVLRLGDLADVPGFSDAPPDLVAQILEEGARFCEEALAPINRAGDREGCAWSPDGVRTPTGFREAYAAMTEAGWPALSADPAYGGQGLPGVLNVAFSEMSSAANMAFSMYPGLTHGAYSAIRAGGSDSQKALFLPRLASAVWAGTMNLTEPQCGTDLGLIRTRAEPAADGSYRISGQKIWISGGEQDLTENIIHLVLARIDGAPAGVRGISLFIVPKRLPGPDGSVGPANPGVSCLGLEEKMGIHGSATCVMGYDQAIGYLVGEPNSGLRHMFVMMNEARLGVAVQGLAQAEAAHQAACAFARERLQGRALTGPKNPDGPADPILVHPDVRRLLMDSRAVIEGGRALLLWAALQADLARLHPDPDVRARADDFVGLLTPVLKAYMTDRGLKICSDSMQVHGGAGFTEHFPVSQYLRDVRISLIYEGTNGVQALDLVGRKLAANGGRAITAFLAELAALAAEVSGEAELEPFAAGLVRVRGDLEAATLWLMQNAFAAPENAGAASSDYLNLAALAAMTYAWTRVARAATVRIAAGETDRFYADKLVTGRHFLERILPDAGACLERVRAGAATLMALPAEAF